MDHFIHAIKSWKQSLTTKLFSKILEKQLYFYVKTVGKVLNIHYRIRINIIIIMTLANIFTVNELTFRKIQQIKMIQYLMRLFVPIHLIFSIDQT